MQVDMRIAPTMLHSIDGEGRIQEVSDLWLAKLDYVKAEVIGRRSTEFLSERSARYARDQVLPTFFDRGWCEVEYEMRRKDGSVFPVRLRGVAVRDEQGAFVRSIAAIEDITDRQQLERRLVDLQRLENIATMAGSVAHDFNNLLATVSGNAQLARKRAGDLPGIAHSLEGILTATSFASDLCRQLLAYSGRGRLELELVDLGSLVLEMAKVLEISIERRAAIDLALTHEDARVIVDATQARQVIMNLVLNAADAVGEQGRIRIATAVVELDDELIAQTALPDIRAGRYVCLEVCDDGRGIAADVAQRIFEPHFTTKPTGNGLGLPAVHRIVRDHHGTLQVKSRLGCGTRFRVFLPTPATRASSCS